MLHELLAILFPSPCVSCGFLGQALCQRCGQNLRLGFGERAVEDLRVRYCMPFVEGTLLERLIHPFKYSHQADLFRYFVPFLREALRVFEGSDVLLVPVPLHSARELERGYNQVELLVKWLAKDLGLEHAPLLRRVRDTGHQARLKTRAERANNLEGAFALAEAPPKNRQIVLVDDIVTTGSTLLACAKVLHEAGAQDLSALCLASREEKTHPWN